MKGHVIILIVIVAISQVSSSADTKIDQVLDLLENLRATAQKEKQEISDGFAKRDQRKQVVIKSLADSSQEQRFECFNKQNDVTQKQKEIAITNDYVAWMLKRQSSNNLRISTLESLLCDRGNNYVRDIKNDKIALTLVKFLQKQTHQIKEGKLSLAESKMWTKKVNDFVQFYQSGRLYQMVQDFPDNQADEPISENQIVDVIDNIDLALQALDVPPALIEEKQIKLGSTRQNVDIDALLNDIEKEILNDMSNDQDNTDFKATLQKENDIFEKHINEEKQNLIKLNNQLINRQQKSDLCQARLGQISTAFKIASDDATNYKQNIENLLKQKDSESVLFEDVHRIYKNQVANAPEELKSRIEQQGHAEQE